MLGPNSRLAARSLDQPVNPAENKEAKDRARLEAEPRLIVRPYRSADHPGKMRPEEEEGEPASRSAGRPPV
jgi:hypothetical protein